jgi:hypothetical protein
VSRGGRGGKKEGTGNTRYLEGTNFNRKLALVQVVATLHRFFAFGILVSFMFGVYTLPSAF